MLRPMLTAIRQRLGARLYKALERVARRIHPTNKSGNNASVR